MVPCSQKFPEETTLVTEAAPFYPQQQQGGYHDGTAEYYEDPYDEHHQYQQHQQAVELPKKKSLADLGLDSLGFVSDTDEGDDSGQDTASPQTLQRRQRVMSSLEGGGEGPPGQPAHGTTAGTAYYGHGAEQQQDDGFGGDGYYSQGQGQGQAQGAYHSIPAQHQQYEQYQHLGGIPAHPQHPQHQYAEGGAYPHPGGWSQYPQHAQQQQCLQQYPRQHHQHGGGGDGYYGDGEGGGGDGRGGHVVDEYGYAWEDMSRGAAGGYDPDEMGDLDEHEFLTFLQESFPGYSLESLEELLAANNHDISLTMEMLTDLDVEEKPPEPPPLDDESNFPTLGGGSGGGGGGGDNNGVVGGSQSATPGGTAHAEADNGPPSPPSEIFRSFTISGGRSNVRGAAAVIPSVGGAADENGNFADRLRTQSSIPAPLTTAGSTERGSVQIGYGSGNFGGQQRSHASQQPWVETGEAVSNMYASTRENARDHMRLRNICFQQATQAYLTGNKALAKELSRKGRNHAQAMRAAHDEAAGTIFKERNANIQQPGGAAAGPRMFDLHGLHVAEAVTVLRRELPNCAAKGERVVHVLVGTGHHVKGSRTPARLPAAVAEYLSAQRIRFWEPQAGMLEVDVASVVG
jgi:hypothetical protein